jgi:uncharacterized membrane protein YfcA
MALAGVVHGALGLGFSMVATSALALFTDVQSAILITLFPTISVNLISIYRGGRWRESIGRFWPLALFAAVGGMLGTQTLILSDPSPFRLLLAAIILLYLNLERLRRIRLDWIQTHPLGSMALFGLVGGFLAGTVNVMVPILVIFTLELGLTATAMVQLFNLCFFAGKVSQVGVFSLSGLIDPSLLETAVPGVAVAIISLLGGMSIRDRIETETYRRILKRVLLLIACILIGQYLLGV